MASSTAFRIGVVDVAASRDDAVVVELAELVNDVYASAEEGLWQPGATRTSPSEIVALIAKGEIATATDPGGSLVGSVRIHQIAADTGELGMLVASRDRRGLGIGRQLVAFAEHVATQRGLPIMQLELLVPRDWEHPSKEVLRSWYARIGYRVVDRRDFADKHPHLAPLLATPCTVEVWEKPLE